MNELRVTFPQPCAEKWEDMSPSGCNRFCATCDKTIHDLSQLDFEQAETLLRSDEKVCVRAVLDSSGIVALKDVSQPSSRKMMLALGASLGLIAIGSPLAAKDMNVGGAISGKLEGYYATGWVTATNADGSEYRAKVTRYGHYRFKKLPAGTYILRFDSDCGEPWISAPIVVRNKKTSKIGPIMPDDSDCIIIGVMSVDRSMG